MAINENDLPPNSHIVEVDHGDYTKYYQVFNIQSYIRKCNEEGKNAWYAGETDQNGKLISIK